MHIHSVKDTTSCPNNNVLTVKRCCNSFVAPCITLRSWAAYNYVQSLPNIAGHQVINHSLHFVFPARGVHTQNIESYWNRVKIKVKMMKGCHAQHLQGYLYEWKWSFRWSALIIQIPHEAKLWCAQAVCSITSMNNGWLAVQLGMYIRTTHAHSGSLWPLASCRAVSAQYNWLTETPLLSQ